MSELNAWLPAPQPVPSNSAVSGMIFYPWRDGWRYALIIFIITRLLLSGWAILVLAVSPLPTQPDEALRPYLGEPPLVEGVAALLLGPWQRFDTMHYLQIARSGYADIADSVFPFLYPLAIRVVGAIPSLFLPLGQSHLLAGIIISNLAFIGSLVLLYVITASELDAASARRTLVYLALFPTGFFLLAPYTESLFLFLVLSAFLVMRYYGRCWQAGLLGFLASLTRLTGWILVVPLAYEYLRQRRLKESGHKPIDRSIPAFYHFLRPDRHLLAALLPFAGLMSFLAYRWWAGLPPIASIYRHYWHQTTTLPGIDLGTAVRLMAAGEGAFTLYFDFLITFFLLGTTILVFRRIGPTYGLYAASLLFFMLLPTSELKPLFSFSRYALAFFPTFMLMGEAGRNPWINRLILYPSIALYLYFSGQFFMWGWVA